MKTAMQELIDDIGKYIKVDWPMNKSIRNSINEALEKEKEGIICAWNDSKVSMMSGEQYFEETYNQSK